MFQIFEKTVNQICMGRIQEAASLAHFCFDDIIPLPTLIDSKVISLQMFILTDSSFKPMW